MNWREFNRPSHPIAVSPRSVSKTPRYELVPPAVKPLVYRVKLLPPATQEEWANRRTLGLR